MAGLGRWGQAAIESLASADERTIRRPGAGRGGGRLGGGWGGGVVSGRVRCWRSDLEITCCHSLIICTRETDAILRSIASAARDSCCPCPPPIWCLYRVRCPMLPPAWLRRLGVAAQRRSPCSWTGTTASWP